MYISTALFECFIFTHYFIVNNGCKWGKFYYALFLGLKNYGFFRTFGLEIE